MNNLSKQFFRLGSVTLLGALLAVTPFTTFAAKEIRIGIIYDLTGPLAGAGSVPASLGTPISIALLNATGGAPGNCTVAPITGHAQAERQPSSDPYRLSTSVTLRKSSF